MMYRRDIDGLRAIAVLAVFLFHAQFSLVSGGFIGVDIFFVISGYVIAPALCKDVASSTKNILFFYARRVRRIFPALFTTFIATTFLVLLINPPFLNKEYFESLISASGFVSNFYFWLQSNYFSASNYTKPLLHTWSLAVEEQYYIFIPVILLILKRLPHKIQIFILTLLLLLSFGVNLYLTPIDQIASFFLLPARLWEFLLGLILAIAPPSIILPQKAKEIIAAVGLCLIGYGIFCFSGNMAYPGYRALYPCVGTALIIYAGSQRACLVNRILAIRPLVGLGRISYSFYLIHWPLLVFFHLLFLRQPHFIDTGLILLLTTLLAVMSWKYIEQPFRRLDEHRACGKILKGGISAILACMLLGWVGDHQSIDTDHPMRSSPTIKNIKGQEQWNEDICFLWKDPSPDKWQQSQCHIINGHKKTALLWGDSYAAHYVPGLMAHKDRIPYNVVQYTKAGCAPLMSYHTDNSLCDEFNARAVNIIHSVKADIVVLSAEWTKLDEAGFKHLQGTLDTLEQMGVQTYVIGQSPEFTMDVQILNYRSNSALNTIGTGHVSFEPALNEKLKALSGNHFFVDPMMYLCPNYECPYIDHGAYLFSDMGHFSAEGSIRAVGLYFPLLNKKSTSDSFVNE